AMKRTDIIFITRANLCDEKKLESLKNEILKISEKKVFLCELLIKEFENLKTGENYNRDCFHNKEVCAFCGIGNPLSFKALLEKNNIKVKKFLKFPDHFRYSQKTFKKFQDGVYLTTEKDAVKIRGFAGENIFSVKTEVKFDDNIVKNFLQV
ncbi:MAG: tetraacyldisaccharide 4'-kinase, partial [Elusimicrobia bacterium]|nr:tetraacyldisaccharide 4'-kinase [Elusimicrobiota bacterium]